MSTIAITGADGCVGTALLRRLAREEVECAALVHAADLADLQVRAAALRERVGLPSLRVLPLELAAASELGGVLRDLEVSTLVHAAGVTAFRVERELAQRVNVQGTADVLEAARGLELHTVFLGSVYASGLTPGLVPEAPMPRPERFANFYEESKYDAECLVLEALSAGQQVSLLRSATILADTSGGEVGFQNAVHQALRLLYRGLLPILPADPATPLYLVTAEAVAEALWSCVEEGPGVVANLSPGAEEALTVDALLDTAFEVFERHEAFARRRTPRPLLSDLATFGVFADAVDPLADHLVAAALRALRPFAPQLHVSKEVVSARGQQLAAPIPLALTSSTLARVCAALTRSGLASQGVRHE